MDDPTTGDPPFRALPPQERKKLMLRFIEALRAAVDRGDLDPMGFEARMAIAKDRDGGPHPSGHMTYTFEVFNNTTTPLYPDGRAVSGRVAISEVLRQPALRSGLPGLLRRVLSEARGKLVTPPEISLRPEVEAFAQLMEAKLREHDEERGEHGWKYDKAHDLLVRLKEEVEELESTVKALELVSQHVECALPLKRVSTDEAVDVANFTRMIVDVLGGLKSRKSTDDE